MPELPEIEIVGRNLSRWMIGRRIESVEPLRETIFRDGTLPRALEVVGERVTGIERRGKALWLETSGSAGWLMRFGMTGKWILQQGEESPKHARVRVRLDDGGVACLLDQRNFGGIWGLERALGPAALRAGVPGRDPVLEGLSGEDLEALFKGRQVAVKALLLDQGLVAGVGNIYASESLYRAGIDPRMAAGKVSPEALARLARAIIEILEWAIEVEWRDEVKYFGEAGAENIFAVYQRAGEGCGRCGTPIERVVIAARSTFYCPECQTA